MRDAQGSEIRRGERILDANGDIFMVKDVGPASMHIQNAKTGRRYTIGLPVFLKVPHRTTEDEKKAREKNDGLSTPAERRAYFRRRAGARRH